MERDIDNTNVCGTARSRLFSYQPAVAKTVVFASLPF